jgi:N-methylhydantoinase A
LLAFGGAGPLHAAALSETMEISRLVVPIFPGLFSALGLLLADYRHDYIRSIVTPLEIVELGQVLDCFNALEESAVTEMRSEGIAPEAIKFERYADLKYGYQLQELTLRFPQTDTHANISALLRQVFTEAHERAFGYHADDPIELVSLRLRALAKAGQLRFAELANVGVKSSGTSGDRNRRQVYFGRGHGLLDTPVLSRQDISRLQHGPMIIEEPDTTVIVPPGWSVSRDEYSNLVLSKT